MLRTVLQKLLSRRTGQRGAAGAEFVITLPLWVLFITGIVALIMGIYVRLAVMTAAGDCALMTAQRATTSDYSSTGGKSNFMTDKPVEFAQDNYGVDMGLSASPGGCYVRTNWELPYWETGFVDYRFSFPSQRYKSDWSGK